jgi:membrane fusion protein (multidrug efflux system)
MEEKRTNQIRRRRKIIAFIVFSVIIVVGAVAIYFYLQYKKTHISTDDAFVDGRIHTIASKVSGTVKTLSIQDNQFVKAGDVLLEIDPQDYQVKVKEARAGLETEKARFTQILNSVDTVNKQLAQIIASLEGAQSNLKLQEANLHLAELEFKRSEALFQRAVIPKQQYDQSKTAYEVSIAQVKAAADSVKGLEASIETQKALIRQTEAGIPPQQNVIKQNEAALQAAELNLSYTKIYAPVDGHITNRTVEIGNQIQPAQPLMAVVPLNRGEIWITANYKETDLTRVKPGQKVKIKVDTYPGKEFNGRVNSIMAGTGAVFSLFPPENATGNFVKVVQRIPVKIVLDPGEDPHQLLRIGMSVVPTILTEP